MMPAMRASLFIPCLIDLFSPETGINMARLLRHLGVEVDAPARQTCCGQPAFNAGHREEAAPVASRFVELFAGAEAIVTPSGSCAAMVREHYRDLPLPPETARRAKELPVFEFTEFVVRHLGAGSSAGGLANRLSGRLDARVAYHPSCHGLRELGLKSESETLLRRIEGLTLVPLDDAESCCGFGGTFSVDFAELSTAMGSDRCTAIEAAEVDYVVATDAGCLLQIGGLLHRRGAPTKAVHIVDLLATGAGLANGDLGATYSP